MLVLGCICVTLAAQSSYTNADLVWQDEFEGEKLNTKNWNYEIHAPGWVNHEWQSYVMDKKNVYVKDGNLIIQPIKGVDSNGKVTYTSGRINTEHKNYFKYGRIEARIKMPKGQGIWPAFWMMPEDQAFYGPWPRCGEIDISEVLGDNPKLTYGTIHYGLPHGQKQGTKTVTEGPDLWEDYHVYAIEWEPSQMRWYLDGECFVTIDDWYTKTPGYDEITYPAPFDQPFFIILNVAVGGDWPGYPDATTLFDETAQMKVDYVRVYQKKSYDENVKKPEQAAVSAVVDNSGNMVRKGPNHWEFKKFGGGNGSLVVTEDNVLTIKSTEAGTLEYSVQVVQPDIAFEQGTVYKYSFDAWADAERTFIPCISQPEVNFERIMQDVKEKVGKTKKHYEYTINMTKASDAHGRIEFNLGAQNSTATVYVENLRLEAVGQIDYKKFQSATRPDGNYVKNGRFDEGEARLGNWETKVAAGSSISVTNENKVRELKVENKKVKAITDNQICQKGLNLPANAEITISFDARISKSGKLLVSLDDFSKEVVLSKEQTKYEFTYNSKAANEDAVLTFSFGNSKQTVWLDNVMVKQNILFVNGDFEQDMSGFEVYAHGDASESHKIVSEESGTDGKAFKIQINKTGGMDWMVQLIQRRITLKSGQTYKLTFNAKSDMDRTIMFALQRDGSSDDNWIPYSGTIRIDLTKEMQVFSHEFVMDYDTDLNAMLSISMGAVGNTVINTSHAITIDSISLELVK